MRYDFFESVGEGLFSETLENGLAVFVFPKKGFHKAFAHFAVHYGGSDMRYVLGGQEKKSPAGVAHFLEHKLFDTKKGNALTLLAQQGASPNAYTGNGMTAYHFTCTERFFENLEILLSFVTEPYFTAESVAKEQGIIGQEIGMYDDAPDHQAYMGLMQALYKENPIRTDIAGTVESIAQITPETLYACHEAFYTPGNMALTVVGDVDPEKVLDYAKRLTPKEGREVPGRCYGQERGDAPQVRVTAREMAVSIPQFYLGCALPAPDGGPALQRFSLLADLAASYLCSQSAPLYNSLYGQRLINQNFGAGADFFPGGGVLLCAGESSQPEQVLDAFFKALESCRREGLDATRFARLKNAAIGNCIFALNSFDNMCYNQANDYFFGARYMDSFAVLQSLQLQDLMDFMRQALDPERVALSVVQPLEKNL